MIENKKELTQKGYKVGNNVARDVPKYVIWVLRLLIIAIILYLISLLIPSAKALGQTFNTNAFNDVYYNDTISNRLMSFVPYDKSYCVVQVNDYDYYVFFSNHKDSTLNNGVMTFNNCDYVRYYRQGSNYAYNYQYSVGSYDTVNITLNNKVVTSDIDDYKYSSHSFIYHSYVNEYRLINIVVIFFIIITTAQCLVVVKRKLV